VQARDFTPAVPAVVEVVENNFDPQKAAYDVMLRNDFPWRDETIFFITIIIQS
jgi:hypothetical protein